MPARVNPISFAGSGEASSTSPAKRLALCSTASDRNKLFMALTMCLGVGGLVP
jgi:hypothetical protein